MQQPGLQEDLLRAGGAAAVQTQLDAVREGHCNLLPASQLEPMLRVQVARDQALAQTVTEQVSARTAPGQTVLLIAGGAHVDARVGMPLFLAPGLRSASLLLSAQAQPGAETQETTDRQRSGFDARWTTAAPPPKDYCARLRPSAGG
jgi:uncharacterized iron-regulated protein